MPLAEIPHRIKESFLKNLFRYSCFARRDARLPAGLSGADLPLLPLNLDSLKSAISAHDRSRLHEDVNRLCAKQIELLGQRWCGSDSSDWSLDPESGEHWRWGEYTFDIPRRSGQGPGDVKFVWEIARLQHLQVLALGAFVFDRDDAKQQCLEYLEAWLHDNPPYKGLAYASGIELASRVISILFIVRCLGTDSIPESLVKEIWTALAVHGRWIARFPSLYSSANNHLIAEHAALFVLGAVSPALPESRRWKSIGWATLTRESARQIRMDGAGAEQSPTYLAYTMEWLLLARVVFGADQGSNDSALDDALGRGALFLSNISDMRGNSPAIGDCDNSVVLRPTMREDDYPASIVYAIAGVLQRGDILHSAFRSELRSQLLTSRPAPDSTLCLGSSVFEQGGYTVLRSSEGSREVFLMFDHGPLGFAHTAAHGHADALSVWLHLDGQPILVDFGTYRYNADAGWRDWARGTAAHNTVELNRQSQSEMTGPFNWGYRANGQLLEYNIGGSRQFCRASHDGYTETHGVTHEREVAMEGTDLLLISDCLSGRGRYDVKLHFHFSPMIRIESFSTTVFSVYCQDIFVCDVKIDCPGMIGAIRQQIGNFEPGPGAVSPEYNKLHAATSLVVSGQVILPYTSKVVFRMPRRD